MFEMTVKVIENNKSEETKNELVFREKLDYNDLNNLRGIQLQILE